MINIKEKGYKGFYKKVCTKCGFDITFRKEDVKKDDCYPRYEVECMHCHHFNEINMKVENIVEGKDILRTGEDYELTCHSCDSILTFGVKDVSRIGTSALHGIKCPRCKNTRIVSLTKDEIIFEEQLKKED